MTEKQTTPKGTPFNLEQFISYAEGAVVSKTLHKKEIGNITLFAFDQGQGLSEHTAPFDAVVYILDGDAKITIDGKLQAVTNHQNQHRSEFPQSVYRGGFSFCIRSSKPLRCE